MILTFSNFGTPSLKDGSHMIQELYQALPVPTNIRKYNYQISPKIIMELSEGKSAQIFTMTS